MEPTLLGLVLDSSFLIAAERRRQRPIQAIESIQQALGDIPIVLSPISVAEVGHGIYRANTPELQAWRRLFLDELIATVPVHPITDITAKIVARIGGKAAANGVNLPLGDLMIGACAIELSYAVGTSNLRDFGRIAGLTVVQL